LTAVKAGQRILFDDGTFEGTIREVRPDQFRVELFRAGAGTAKLRAEKGINVPDTQLQLSALTEKDLQDLKFVACHANMVSLSFVHTPQDIEQLHGELERLGAHELGIILKIENRQAFEQLPRLLMTALRRPPVAVMVARGDLGVEIGFERMAEVQEEMLWLCESAHVPVIWATQVLESLAKQGVPSRGEVTDAAMSCQAECVMLNKGPYMSETIRFLCDVSQRMSQHRVKRVATLRRLSVADAYHLP
jgi:pyruvate kinase